jgi:hypothetical protein
VIVPKAVGIEMVKCEAVGVRYRFLTVAAPKEHDYEIWH